MKKLILASTSRYRKQLMAQAGYDAECVMPDYEEKQIDGMHPLDLISHHALCKAQSVSHQYYHDIVIGSDQGLVAGDRLLGKPGTVAAACEQLKSLCGKTAMLATSLAVICGNMVYTYQDKALLQFRNDLSDAVIISYVKADMPLDCAGSFKIESCGPRLFSSISCQDPTAIQGLPMMKLNEFIVAIDADWDCQFIKESLK